jgi:hypothetical protein
MARADTHNTTHGAVSKARQSAGLTRVRQRVSTAGWQGTPPPTPTPRTHLYESEPLKNSCSRARASTIVMRLLMSACPRLTTATQPCFRRRLLPSKISLREGRGRV